MDFYLLRHGEAEPRTTAAQEASRRLTPAGRRDVRRVVAFARRSKFAPDAILTSPYLRARETAEIAADLLGVTEIVETRNLLPSAAPEALWKDLAVWSGAKQILLAGHEPHMSRFAAFLLNAAVPLAFKKGALVRITGNAPPATPEGILRWLIPPALLR
jgi:phosphohistidine phosphatase